MLKNFVLFLFLLGFTLLSINILLAKQSKDSFSFYEVIVSRESYKQEQISDSGAMVDVYGIFLTYYYDNKEVFRKRVNSEFKYSNGSTANVGSPYVAINDNGKIMVLYLSYITPLTQRVPYGHIYDLKTGQQKTMIYNFNSGKTYENNTVTVGSIKDRFYFFFEEKIFDYTDPDDFSFEIAIYFEIYDEKGNLIKERTELDRQTGRRQSNNIQIKLLDSNYENLVGDRSIKRINDNQLVITWLENDYNEQDVKNQKYARIINYDGSFDGDRFKVNNFSFEDLIDYNNKCTINDWDFVLDPEVCPLNGKQTIYWTKNSNCILGIRMFENEDIVCEYKPEKPYCTEEDWTYRLEPEYCPPNGKQMIYRTKITDCISDILSPGIWYPEVEEFVCDINLILDEKDLKFSQNLAGRILLQVEENGEAWYVSPENLKRYFLGRPDDAFSVMREQGIGITNSDLAKIPVSLDYLSGPDTSGDGLPDDFKIALGLDVNSTDSDGDGYSDYEELLHGFNPLGPGRLNHDLNFAQSQAGRILLQVEQNGEAWYVSPENNKRYFLGRPADAFSIMRNLGLGISNENLERIIAN